MARPEFIPHIKNVPESDIVRPPDTVVEEHIRHAQGLLDGVSNFALGTLTHEGDEPHPYQTVIAATVMSARHDTPASNDGFRLVWWSDAPREDGAASSQHGENLAISSGSAAALLFRSHRIPGLSPYDPENTASISVEHMTVRRVTGEDEVEVLLGWFNSLRIPREYQERKAADFLGGVTAPLLELCIGMPLRVSVPMRLQVASTGQHKNGKIYVPPSTFRGRVASEA